jgi:putative transposase
VRGHDVAPGRLAAPLAGKLLSHTKWECKYHVVFIPKCRRKTLYAELRRQLGEVFRKLAEQKESRVEEGHLLPDHVHMLISIPPKYAVSQVIWVYQGKECDTLGSCVRRKEEELCRSALLGERVLRLHSRTGPRGDTRKYIRKQEEEDKRLEQMNLLR